MTGLLHPEYVAGRRLWLDSAMTDLIDKLHHGDPVRGWEGDERLAVYWNDPRWEVWRLEDDGEYRIVCRSKPGIPFDERVIDSLCEWDVRRRQEHIADEIIRKNAARDREREQHHYGYMTEEAIPRVQHAVRKEAGW